jgi:hypothetical protein
MVSRCLSTFLSIHTAISQHFQQYDSDVVVVQHAIDALIQQQMDTSGIVVWATLANGPYTS